MLFAPGLRYPVEHQFLGAESQLIRPAVMTEPRESTLRTMTRKKRKALWRYAGLSRLRWLR